VSTAAGDAQVRIQKAVRAYAHAMIHTAALWDILGAFGVLAPWWPPIGYVLACAGIVAACLEVLATMLSTPRAAHSAPRTAGRLLAIGILLGTWILRGDAEIEPDTPLIVAQAVAALLYAALAVRRPR
jgi:hypothetical protein